MVLVEAPPSAAKKMLATLFGIRIVGYVSQIGEIQANLPDPTAITLETVEQNIVRCPDPVAAEKMITLIEQMRC